MGPGCKRCDQLYENTLSAAAHFENSAGIEVKKISDIKYFAQMGVFVTPGLVIDGEVVSVGKVLGAEDIQKKIAEKI